MSTSACQDLPPDAAEQARKARAMEKMEAEQAESDLGRAAVVARAEAEAAKSKAASIAQERHGEE